MILVKHSKVSAIADDPSAVAAGEVVPSDWNADHSITGLGTAAEQDVEFFATAAQGAKADTALQLVTWDSPGAIGSTTPAAATFTTLTATGQTSLGGDASNPSLVASAVSGSTRWLQVAGSSVGNVTLSLQGVGNPAFQMIGRGTGAFTFSTNGSSSFEQMRVSHTASAVNYVQVTGSASTFTPVISAQGSDSSIPIALDSKGSSSTFLRAGGLTVFAALRTASSVNYLTAKGSIASSPVELGASGSDTNIDIRLTPKGTGNVRFGTYTGTALAIAGYIEIKTADGVVRKLAVVA